MRKFEKNRDEEVRRGKKTQVVEEKDFAWLDFSGYYTYNILWTSVQEIDGFKCWVLWCPDRTVKAIPVAGVLESVIKVMIRTYLLHDIC